MIRSHLLSLAAPLLAVLSSPLLAAEVRTGGDPETDPDAFLQEVLGVMESHWLFSHQVDWNELRLEALAGIDEAESHGDTFAAIYRALRDGGDRHSYLLAPDPYARWRGRQAREASAPAVLDRDDWRSHEPFEGLETRLLDGHVGYVKLPPLGSADERVCRAYATHLYEGIRALDAERPHGWVVDLRENTGGNLWPMLAGLSSLIGPGRAGAFVSREGSEDFGVSAGRAWSAGPSGRVVTEQAVATAPFELSDPRPRIAVLTGPHTASSGEVVAAAFRGQDATRSFGARTAGYSTGNRSFELSDGSCLFLATSVCADRTGTRFPAGIACDEPVAETDAEGADAVVRAALAWLTQS